MTSHDWHPHKEYGTKKESPYWSDCSRCRLVRLLRDEDNEFPKYESYFYELHIGMPGIVCDYLDCDEHLVRSVLSQ